MGFAIFNAIAILPSGALLAQHRVQVRLLCVFCAHRRRRGEDGAEVSVGGRRRGTGSGSGGGGRLLLGLHWRCLLRQLLRVMGLDS